MSGRCGGGARGGMSRYLASLVRRSGDARDRGRLRLAHLGRLGFAAALLTLPSAAQRLDAQVQVLIVSGLGGEPKYRREFADLSVRLSGAMRERLGVPDSCVVWLGEDSAHVSPAFGGRSTRDNVARVVDRFASRASAGDAVVFVLIGHGAGEGAESRIALPGPDLAADDFSRILERFAAQRIAFLDLTSASGDMLPVLAGPNRVIVTATKTSFERNESHFGAYFVDALSRDGADANKDGRVSLLEAFRYASRETKRLYDDSGRLQTEHAQLDDDGDGQGSADPTGRTGDGMLARRIFLDAGTVASRAASGDARLAALYADAFALEERVEALKREKSAYTPAAYDEELERRLVALARKAREMRSAEGLR